MPNPFKTDSYPYEFIHQDNNDIEVMISFKKELKLDSINDMSDLDILRRDIFYSWFKYKVRPEELKNNDEHQEILKDVIKVIPGRVTQVCFQNEDIEWETFYELLRSLNVKFNLKANWVTENSVVDIKIYGNVKKITRHGQPTKGFVKYYSYPVNYTRTDEGKTKFVFTMDKTFDLSVIQNIVLLESIITNWHTFYVDIHYRPSQVEKKCKRKIENNVITFTIPGDGINTKNLFFLLPRYESVKEYRENIVCLDIFSNDMPTFEHMQKYVDDFWKGKE